MLVFCYSINDSIHLLKFRCFTKSISCSRAYLCCSTAAATVYVLQSVDGCPKWHQQQQQEQQPRIVATTVVNGWAGSDNRYICRVGWFCVEGVGGCYLYDSISPHLIYWLTWIKLSIRFCFCSLLSSLSFCFITNSSDCTAGLLASMKQMHNISNREHTWELVEYKLIIQKLFLYCAQQCSTTGQRE